MESDTTATATTTVTDLEPQVFKTRKLRLKHLVETYGTDDFPTFAREKTTGSDKQEFMVMTYADFMKYYAALDPPERRHHEMIQHDREIRLFFDLESSEILDSKTFSTRCNDAVEFVRAELKKRFNLETVVPIAFDASRETKSSRHVVFPRIYFENVAAMKSFLDESGIFAAFEDVMDDGVYVGGRSLRIPYSVGFGKPAALFPLVRGNPKRTYDADAVGAGLLHRISADEPPTILRFHHRKRRRALNGGELGDDAEAEEMEGVTTLEMEERIRRWAEREDYDVQQIDFKSDEGPGNGSASSRGGSTELQVILMGVTCLNKGRRHNKNKVYLHVGLPRRTGRTRREIKREEDDNSWDEPEEEGDAVAIVTAPSKFVCADASDCNGYWWHGPDFAPVLFGDEFRPPWN